MNDQIKVFITVFYSCLDCGLIKRPVKVEARGEEDVRIWMQKMGAALARDHMNRSPGCCPKTLADVTIPTTGTDRIGGPAIN